jgi:hypothetical protein
VLHKKLSNIDGHFREDVHQVLHVYNFVLVMKKDIRIDSKKKIVPKFTVVDIQMDVSDAEFKKGMALFKGGKVKMLTFDIRGFNAVVSGTHDYSVSVSESHFDRGECSCYLGQNDIYCKHMIALAIAAVFSYRLKDASHLSVPLGQAVCSGAVRDAKKEELQSIQSEVSNGMRMLKSYNGPSKTWFAYQDSLLRGKRHILLALSKLPVCRASADVCISLIVKLDTKLMNSGIDDSDGTVGDLISEIMELLSMFTVEQPELKKYISDKFPKQTNFGWEKELQISLMHE